MNNQSMENQLIDDCQSKSSVKLHSIKQEPNENADIETEWDMDEDLTEQSNDDKISKGMRQRYWHSAEESRLLDLWRRYKDEVIDYQKPLPVYRKIMLGMRHEGFVVTAQECRRKINKMSIKYSEESQKKKLKGYVSKWKLYPLVEVIKKRQPSNYVNDPWHEIKILKCLMDEIQPGLMYSYIAHDPDAILQLNYLTSPSRSNTSTPLYNQNNNRTENKPHSYIFPIRSVTYEKIKAIRAINDDLTKERDEALYLLQKEQKEFRNFEIMLRNLWITDKLQLIQVENNENNESVKMDIKINDSEIEQFEN